jgi:hypothetical protein
MKHITPWWLPPVNGLIVQGVRTEKEYDFHGLVGITPENYHCRLLFEEGLCQCLYVR